MKNFSEIRTHIQEAKEHTYTVVHAKKGKVVGTAPTSYGAAKKAAKQWKLKSTAGVDSYLMEAKQAIVWKVKPPAGTKNVHPDSKWPGMKPGDIEKMNESVELEEAMGKLNAKGEIEMTAKNFAKVHKDYKTKMQGVPYAMQIDPKTGGSALYPVKIIKESVEVVEGDDYKNISKTITQTPKHKRDKKATAAKPAKTNAREVARRKAIERHQAKNAAKKEKGYWDESAKGMVAGFSVEIPKQTISGKTIGGGKNGIFVKAKTSRQAISMAAKRLGVDFKMLTVGKVVKEK